MRCHMAFAEDKTGTNAYPQILEQLKENGKLIEPVLVIFTSDNANFGWYSRMLSNSFPNATVIGSTSAVFYSPEGIAKEGIAVMAVTSGITVSSGVLFEASRYPGRSAESVRQAYEIIEKENTACLEFNASGEGCEDLIMDTFKEIIGDSGIELCGCTAVNAVNPDRPAAVSLNGILYMDACVFVMIHNENGRIGLVKENIYKVSGHFFTTTDADCDERRVYEFDHKSAAGVVASAMQKHTDELAANSIEHPLGRWEDGDLAAIGIREVFADGSMSFYTRVYNQTRVFLLDPAEPVEDVWENTSKRVHDIIPSPSFSFVINCLSRIDYYAKTDRLNEYNETLKKNYGNYIGVTALGEQFNYVHRNQIMLILVFE